MAFLCLFLNKCSTLSCINVLCISGRALVQFCVCVFARFQQFCMKALQVAAGKCTNTLPFVAHFADFLQIRCQIREET